MKSLLFLIFLTIFPLIPSPALADWSPLIDRLVKDGYEEKAVRALFDRPEVRFDPDPMTQKIEALIRKQYRKPLPDQYGKIRDVYKGYLQPDVIDRAYAFSVEHRVALKDIESRYCVPEGVVVSIMLVETGFGRNMGSRKAFNVLASMAVARDFDIIKPSVSPDLMTADNEAFARRRCREKADWAYNELKSLIRYAEQNRTDLLTIPGSIFGAIGLCQFMPSNVSSYGVDVDGDGRIDLFTIDDALYSIGKYLHGHGWKCRMTPRDRHRVIMAYNHSIIYANTVLSIAEKLKIKERNENAKAQPLDPKSLPAADNPT